MEGQRLVYQFKEMPKNIVVIEDEKTESCMEDLVSAAHDKSLERVSMPTDGILKMTIPSRLEKSPIQQNSPKKPRFVTLASPGIEASHNSPTSTTPTQRSASKLLSIPCHCYCGCAVTYEL